DDIILPNAIRTLFYYIEKGNYDVVRGNAYRFTNKNKIFPLEKYVFEKGEIKTNSEYVKKMYLGDTAPYLWGAIYKSELFDNTTYEETIKYKISICEDWVTNLIISRKINRALYVTDYVYGYFFNDESIMSTCIMSRNYQHKIQIILDNYNIFNHYSTQSVRYVRRAKEIIVNFFVPELGYDEYEYKELLNILNNKSFKDVIYSSMPKKFLLFLKYPILYRIYSKIYCLLLFIIRFR
ncbi:hypothetical protein H6A66_17220, partial [Bacteroides caecigallinarum]|uniref:hypothetical protein n=1 Tax=Bacteroides caecigallinarum TaxID=1411144 RepID=UPI00195ABE90